MLRQGRSASLLRLQLAVKIELMLMHALPARPLSLLCCLPVAS